MPLSPRRSHGPGRFVVALAKRARRGQSSWRLPVLLALSAISLADAVRALEVNAGDVFAAAPVGVVRASDDHPPPGEFLTARIGVQRQVPPPPPPKRLARSALIGVHVGPGIAGLDPVALDIGLQDQLLRVSGRGLDVGTVRFAPPEGIDVRVESVSGDLTALTLRLDIATDAAASLRRIELFDGEGRAIPPLRSEADQVLVRAAVPEIDSLTPPLVAPGERFELVIRGRHLRGLPDLDTRAFEAVSEVIVSPPDGVAVGNRPTVNESGTVLSVPVQVADAAALGPRLVRVRTESGESTNAPSPANTLNVASGPLRSLTRFASPLLGVARVEESVPSLEIASLLMGVARGPAIQRIDPAFAGPGEQVTLRLSGAELAGVVAIELVPGEGIVVDGGTLIAQHDRVEVGIAVESGAAAIPRRVVATLADGRELAAPQLFDVVQAAPVVAAISPGYLVRDGQSREFMVQGVNFRQVETARLLPSDGTVLQEFTPLKDTVARLVVSAAADAPTGERVLQLFNATAASTSQPDPFNTLAIVDVVDVASPFAAPLLGVRRERPRDQQTSLIASAPLDLHKGPVAQLLAPDGVAAGQRVEIRVDGRELGGVDSVQIEPADSLVVEALQVAADGESLTFDLIAGADAAMGARTVVLGSVEGAVPFRPASASRLNVLDPDDVAPLAEPDSYELAANGALSVSSSDGVLDNDVDPLDRSLSAALVALPASGSLQLSADGAFSYVPARDFAGVDSFRYVASNGEQASAAATVTLTVGEPLDAVDDAYSVADGGRLEVGAVAGLLANDDIDPELAFDIVLAQEPALGTIEIDPDGAFRYQSLGASGVDVFTYRLATPDFESLPAAVEIVVQDVNEAPVAAADDYSLDADSTLTVPAASGVLANDRDPDQDALIARLVETAESGSLVLDTDGGFTYTPVAGFTGTDSFVYEAVDPSGLANQALVTLEVFEADGTPPGPVFVIASQGDGGRSVRLDWSGYDEAANGGDIDDYMVYQSGQDFSHISQASVVGSTVAGQQVFTVHGVTPGETVYFAVVATDLSGNFDPQVSAVAITPEDTQAPPEVTNLRVVASEPNALELAWTPSADPHGDLTGYRLYVDSAAPVELPPESDRYRLEGLQPATRYTISVTTLDELGNESNGRVIDGATWLPNPEAVSAEPIDSGVDLSWAFAEPSDLVENYAVYVSDGPISDVSAITPVLLRDDRQNRARVTGLDNGQTYHLAVTTRNISGGEDPAVVSVTAQPEADTEGPEVTATLYRGQPLVDGAELTRSGQLTLSASDPAGVSQASFASNGALDAIARGGSPFSAYWSLEAESDGANELRVAVADTLGNVTERIIPVTIALAPPPAPVIHAPADGTLTNQAAITVSGSAEHAADVQVDRDGAVAGEPVGVDDNGSFRVSVSLQDGDNTLTAAARNNRGVTGAASEPIVVTLDQDIPDAPTGISASPREGGIIRLEWWPVDGDGMRYHVYRSTVPFDTAAQALKVNNQPIESNRFDDLTPSDGPYFYRVVAESAAGTPSAPSTQVDATADREPPRATRIEYLPDGAFDPDTERYGPGFVSVEVAVSEPLLATPFLSITPEGGVPMAVDLFQTEDQLYQGSFEISEDTVSATAWAVFSARDAAGNRGTHVGQGETIRIDADGPEIELLEIRPEAPIDNAGGAEVQVELTLTEPVTGASAPALEYSLSSQPETWEAIGSLSESSELAWAADFRLPADAGQFEAETLTFRWRAEDDLGNVGEKIHSEYRFQVYQVDLPPLDPPSLLDAWPLPGGQIGLEWSEVDGAAAYEIWRRAGAGDAFVPVARVFETTGLDLTPADGSYDYTVVSVRQANGQEAVSGPGPVRKVTSDSIPPEPPAGLSLQLAASGIVAQWQAAEVVWPGDENLVYNLYRSDQLEIVDVGGIAPVVEGTTKLFAVDADPVQGQSTYAVTAVDAAGNESQPSGSQYLNVDLLPVSGIAIERFGDAAPEIAWTHGADTLAGFDLYALQGNARFLLNDALLSETRFTDAGYAGGARTYDVVAVDGNGRESLGRELLLPDVKFGLAEGARLRESLINGVPVVVRNSSDRPLTGLTARLHVAGRTHRSAGFEVGAGDTVEVDVPVPGYPGLDAVVSGELYLDYEPGVSERTTLGRAVNLPVEGGGVIMTLQTEPFTRGGAGRVRVRIENPGDEFIQVVTAANNGNERSPEMRVKLLDERNNVLATRAFEQYLGADVVTGTHGFTLARIPAGGSWTSQWQDITVPASAPDRVRVEVQVDHIHHAFGQPGLELTLPGLTAGRTTNLVDTSYFGDFLDAAPAASYGQDPVIITGRAVERASGEPMRDVPLNVFLVAEGFEREIPVVTDGTGRFDYLFEPLPDEAGVYDVSVVHPEILDRPVQGGFVIERLSIDPRAVRLHHPYRSAVTLPIEVRAGAGTSAGNIRFEYRAEDQVDGRLIEGLAVGVDAAIGQLGPGESASLPVTLEAEPTAPASGTLYLRLTSDEAAGSQLAMLAVNFEFSAADPVLRPDPTLISFGLAQGEVRSDTVRISNVGFDGAAGVVFELLDAAGNAAPDWMRLGIDPSPRTIGVGEGVDVPITVRPPSDLPALSETYSLRVTADNHPVRELPVNVAVTQSGVGAALFHVRNMYTATIDDNGNVVEGLAGATIRLQDEIVLTNVHERQTDVYGEALFEEIPAGRYRFRISAPNHEAATGLIRIQPGTTGSESVFLSYSLVDVQWSVTETTIEDEYEIVLSALFETNVPAAVLVSEPMHRTIPAMSAGDVFNSQFELTNHGLIRAIGVDIELPPEDQFFRYELLDDVPTDLAAQERLLVPYRLIAKKDFPPTDGGTGGCFSHGVSFDYPYSYICPDGTEDAGSGSHILSRIQGTSCGGSSEPFDQIGFPGSGGAGGWWNGGGGSRELEGTTCAPDCEGEQCCGATGSGGG